MPKTFNKGGQRRTATLGCGWSCVGHPNEVDAKTRRHMRICEVCKSADKSAVEIPKWDKAIGMSNGWKGVNSTMSGTTTDGLTNIVVNGKRFVVNVEGKTTEERTELATTYAEYIKAMLDGGVDANDIIIA